MNEQSAANASQSPIEGLPPPPFWYLDFKSVLKDYESLNREPILWTSSNLTKVEIPNFEEVCVPPKLPGAPIGIFGSPCVVHDTPFRAELDSITKLYNDSTGPDTPELRDEFSRILKMYKVAYLGVLELLSQTGTPGIGQALSAVKQLQKLYTNLHAILSVFREHCFFASLEDQLENQATERLSAINYIRSNVFSLPLLKMADIAQLCDEG